MHHRPVLKILGIFLMLFSAAQLPPLAVSLLGGDGLAHVFGAVFALNFALGAACWFPLRSWRGELRVRDGFVVVVLFWTVLSAMGALPFLLLRAPSLGVVDAVFESMSGLTTTGATILTAIDSLPRSILYYRQQLQWLGGMGLVVLAVAVMPMLGVGGMQLYRAETPGPVKHSKLTPRIAETAKGLWYIYLGLTAACALCYFFAGMNWFDAVGHAFSTIAIGGFSTHDASLGYFNSNAVNIVAMVFMVLSALNFALHFSALRTRSVKAYTGDPEARAYFALLFVTAAVCVIALLRYHEFEHASDALMQGALHAISIATTTGFTAGEFSAWPGFLPVMLILASTAGGCAGSTAGGMKIMRIVLLYKQGMREIAKLAHPSALRPVTLGGKAVPDNVVNAVWGFLSLYMLSYALLLLLMLASGADAVTAFSAVSACLNNLGPGLGAVAENYAALSDMGKIVLTFAMLLGRLELFTLLLLFTPVFWRG